MAGDAPSIVDRIDDLWEGADALIADVQKLGPTDKHAARKWGETLAYLQTVADAGRSAAHTMKAYNLQQNRHASDGI